eukprot:6205587-Pleurochrysis_carterae.AAC.3
MIEARGDVMFCTSRGWPRRLHCAWRWRICCCCARAAQGGSVVNSTRASELIDETSRTMSTASLVRARARPEATHSAPKAIAARARCGSFEKQNRNGLHLDLQPSLTVCACFGTPVCAHVAERGPAFVCAHAPKRTRVAVCACAREPEPEPEPEPERVHMRVPM